MTILYEMKEHSILGNYDYFADKLQQLKNFKKYTVMHEEEFMQSITYERIETH